MLVTLALALLLRLALLSVRWINADEGAHLLDARLVWQGMVPIIDYASRQPLYTYLLALFVKAFGTSLAAGRLLPLFASLAIAWMIYLIVRQLFDAASGWLAAAIYLFLPYTLIWSTVVKTEMPAVLFVCVSAWLFIQTLQQPRRWDLLLLAGMSAALAFYVRQSTLYLPVAVVLCLWIGEGFCKRLVWQKIAVFSAGFALVGAVVLWFYGGALTFEQMLFSQLNPLNLVWNRVAHSLGILPAAMRIVDREGFRILDQEVGYTLRAWRESILFSFFIVTAALWSLGRYLSKRNKPGKDPAYLFLALWIFILLLAYAFQSASRGFYSQYFLESLPAWLILAVPVIRGSLQGRHLLQRFVTVSGLFVLLFLAQRLMWQWRWPLWGHVVAAVVISAAVLLIRRYAFARETAPLTAAGLAVLMMTASVSGSVIGPKYECGWSPRTLDRVVALLQQQGQRSDTVLSGAMIWTHTSGLQPWGGVSHPTLFFMKYDPHFERDFEEAPPLFIIMDGYTEKKFSRYRAFLDRMVAERYERLASVPGSKWRVDVYRLAGAPALPEAALAARLDPPRELWP